MTQPLNILQVSTLDLAGGAEQVGMNLHRAFRAMGHQAWLAVGRRLTDEPGVLCIDNDAARSAVARASDALAARVASRLPSPAAALLRRAGLALTQPLRVMDVLRGREDFHMPATRRLLQLPPSAPDVVHCHNLHGFYFDLRELPALSARIPLVLTLHDMWTFTGHCAYSLGCERWRLGCGRCPDLDIFPSVRRDATAFNLARKREIYRRSRLRVATPSRWLMDKVRSSVLAEGIIEARVIPYGVDLATFHPEGRPKARADLGLEADARVLLYAANLGAGNRFKDFATVQEAVARVAERLRDRRLILLVLGGSEAPRRDGPVRIVPHVKDRALLAHYYRAADLFLHAAHEDNFPNTVLESLACGTPVVATAAGGIPEQIEHGVTGVLVPPKDPDAMAQAAVRLLGGDETLRAMSARAAETARARYDLQRQARDYVDWFVELRSAQTNAG